MKWNEIPKGSGVKLSQRIKKDHVEGFKVIVRKDFMLVVVVRKDFMLVSASSRFQVGNMELLLYYINLNDQFE